MLIRIQSCNGLKRVDVTSTESTKSLYEKANTAFGLTGASFSLHKTRDRKNELVSNSHRTLKGYKICHGDMIFLFQDTKLETAVSDATQINSVASSSTLTHQMANIEMPSTSNNIRAAHTQQHATNIKSLITEDQIDQILGKMDGRVERKLNPASCHHKADNKCIYCTSLDPWDPNIMKSSNFKHLSFHAHLRKMISGVDKGKFTYLEDLNCRIKPGCSSHPPWPQGICSKCQPSAVTLNRQTFRHIDNVTFENPHIVERFLNYWRLTGHQRIGFLYGKHQPHLDVPLGIKASIAAIYEPPQEGAKDYCRLLPDPKQEVVDEIAKQMGLVCVGWIFTDLVPLDATSGTVKYLRHANSYFLSAREVIMAGRFQQRHQNPCRLAPSGYYGSKFATVIVTGDKNNQVHMEGYQVSNQCQSLVRDECLIPTKDYPQFAYVKESLPEQYVPDVYFKEKDQYGNEVVRLGRPLPVEYLLLDCPVSTPNEPIFTFTHSENPFPVENRMIDGFLQDFPSVVKHFGNSGDDQFLETMSDFHFLIFLATMDMLPLKDHMTPLLEAIAKQDSTAALQWKQGEQWATVEQLMSATRTQIGNGEMATGQGSDVAGAAISQWTCIHCTFINLTATGTCAMCSLPRQP